MLQSWSAIVVPKLYTKVTARYIVNLDDIGVAVPYQSPPAHPL